MANPIEIYQVCGKCHGDGQFPNAYIDFEGNIVEPETTVDCPQCEGVGRLTIMTIDGDLRGILKDILGKCDDNAEKLIEIKAIVDEL